MTHKETAESAYNAVDEELRALSLWLYENPETAYKEFESSKRLSEFLAGHGFDVTYPAYGLETAFEVIVAGVVDCTSSDDFGQMVF